MLHTDWPKAECAGSHFLRRRAIEFVTHPKIEHSRNHRDVLYLRVPVRRDDKPIGEPESHGKHARFGWVAFQDGHLGAFLQRRWSVFPLHLTRQEKAHLTLHRVSGSLAEDGWADKQ